MSAPIFISEQKTLNRILHWFIDQLDKQGFAERTKRLIFHIKQSNRLCRALYQFDDEADFIWSCIQQLSHEYGMFDIKLDPKSNIHSAVYHNARLLFNPEQEKRLRQWLSRPVMDSYTAQWNKHLTLYSHKIKHIDVLLDKPIRQEGWTIRQIIQGLINAGEALSTPMTLRQLSSQCFLSDSKFLDHREALVKALYPSLYTQIIHRPVIINCYLPKQIDAILFIENQDTFLEYSKTQPTDMAVIYSAGFKTSDKTIRHNQGVIFSVINPTACNDTLMVLQKIWFNQKNNDVPFYFWGDLDYAGLGILKALKEPFPTLRAWEPGYAPMLERLEKGLGHSARQSNKTRQIIPEATGCVYTDNRLLPALRKHQAFVDQEIYQMNSN